MGVNPTGETVMPVGVFRNASRAEVLGSKHTTRRHDPDQGIELRFFGVLPVSAILFFHVPRDLLHIGLASLPKPLS